MAFIIFPMLGRSSRFYNAGYKCPKYMLKLGSNSVFSESVRSFEALFESDEFIFIVRKDGVTKSFITSEILRLGIKNYKIIEHLGETSGQAESVMLAIAGCSTEGQMIIFNIDTIRKGFTTPNVDEFGDGFLEVFEGSGDGWSFVEPKDSNSVLRTAEKKRISNLCSNGIYGFLRISDFIDAYNHYKNQGNDNSLEVYIAPLYNFLIKKGMDIRYRLVAVNLIEHCGIPADYESLKQRYLKFPE